MGSVRGSVVILQIDPASEKTGPHSKPAEQGQIFLAVRSILAIYEIPEEATGWSRDQVDKTTVKVRNHGELIFAHGER